MAPKTPKKQVAKKQKPNETPVSPSTTIDYAQVQNDEVEALRAIYMDDYEEVETKGAWSKSSDKAFRLHLKAFSDAEVSVLLSVRLTATYPKSSPLIRLEKSNGLRDKSVGEVQQIVMEKPKELLGEVMIYEIASGIQDILEDEALHKVVGEALPTLEEERAEHEAAAVKLAEETELKEMKEKEQAKVQAKVEEDRMLQVMVEEEMARRRELKRKSKAVAASPMPSSQGTNSDAVAFDRVINYQHDGSSLIFGAVRAMTTLAEGPATKTYTVQPVVDAQEYNGTDAIAPLLLVLKKCCLSQQASEEKKKILILEEELEAIRHLPGQENCLKLLDFKIDPISSGWDVFILTEYANKGSLKDFLVIVECVTPSKVRSWTVDLLEAIEFYHRHAIVHKRIHPGNVLLFQSSNGSPTIKLGDPSYQQTLHDIEYSATSKTKSLSARSANWIPPELSQHNKLTRKTDVWDLGIVFLQMLFGLTTPEKHNGPVELLEAHDLSEPLEEIVRKLFKSDPKKRPSAFDLIPSEFLRNNVPLHSHPTSPVHTRYSSSLSAITPDPRGRRSSSVLAPQFSRYINEWIEVGRLGRGGFGEVVKARNKLDGRIYAIKKITLKSTSALAEVLSEVMLLSRLNHTNVVRYYSAWPEEELKVEKSDESDDESNMGASPHPLSIEFGHSTGGLDFISSSGFPKIEFGNDSEEDDDDNESVVEFDDDDEEETEPDTSTSKGKPLIAKRTLSGSHANRPPVKTTLYIQMEYCERHTLRDLIRKDLYQNVDEIWRLFRQILDGLAHIHSHSIIHRDLKPDNIFIDVTNNPKIGDFGLATSGQYNSPSKPHTSSAADVDMTRSIGTTLYVAPELRSESIGSYNDKVDMYSLGIIFFEMSYPLGTGMERAQIIGALREKECNLPEVFRTPEKALQCSVIESLISHRPSDRPSSGELLRSGKIPFQIEDETIQQALKGLSDPSSPYYNKMMAALFSLSPGRQVKEQTWDMGTASGSLDMDANTLMLQQLVKAKLCSIFRRHGAIETQRQLLLPRSSCYTNNNVVQLLDSSGTLVQLPYDLTLPNARAIARKAPATEKTFSFGNVYRDMFSGGAPRSNGEVDFDIVSHDTLDLALKEAEVLKVLDEVTKEFPSFSSSQMCFHLNHADLLDLIMDFSRINASQRPAVKEILSKLGIQQNTWAKIRTELRAPNLGVASISLDDLARFDFRDTPEKAFSKIRKILDGSEYSGKTQAIFAHFQSVVSYAKHLGVRNKIFISPLSCFNEKFYRGGLLFQCIFDTKRRDVLAAGGRYDRLIEEHKPRDGRGQFTGCHAVGMNLGWDRLVTSMARQQKRVGKSSNFLKKSAPPEEEGQGQWTVRRCDVLVASLDSTVLRSAGLRLVSDLWSHDISAELAGDASSPDELLSRYRDDKHSWIIIIKNDAVFGRSDLKVKSLLTKQDADVSRENLISHLRAEIRERDQREEKAERLRLAHRPMATSAASVISDISNMSSGNRPNVHVLVAQHKSKKANRGNVIEAAQSRIQELLASYAGAPIAAVETTDDALEMVRGAKLSDPDSWRRVVQAVPAGDRAYIQQIQGLLETFRSEWQDKGGCRVACVFNFRTGWIALYDLGL